MKKLLAIILFLPLAGFAQYKLEIGVNIGAANYLGDIGGKGSGGRKDGLADLVLGQSRPSLGGYVRYRLHPLITLKGHVFWGRLEAADSLSANPGRQGRNLSFRNDIVEMSGHVEYNFYSANDVGKIAGKRVDFRTYLSGGFGYFINNPKAKYSGQWVELRPLATEGQGIVDGRTPYKKFAMCIPVGVGFAYVINRKYKIGLELGYRKTFTDYIDDVSTTHVDPALLPNDVSRALSNRSDESSPVYPELIGYNRAGSPRGNSENMDSYLYSNINASYVFRGKNAFYRSKYNYITTAKRKIKKRKVRAKF